MCLLPELNLLFNGGNAEWSKNLSMTNYTGCTHHRHSMTASEEILKAFRF